MERQVFDALVTSFWMLLLARFRFGLPVTFEPYEGNRRRVEDMNERVMFLRETTDRAGASTCPIEEFREDLWRLYNDTHDPRETMPERRARLGIKNYYEFKRDTFDQLKQFEARELRA